MAELPELVASFLTEVDPARAPLVVAVHEAIAAVAPQLEIGRDRRMLGYGPYHYRYESGREGDTFVVAMADGARALSIYVQGAEGGRYLAEAAGPTLGAVSVGRSCIRVRRAGQLDLDAFGALVERAVRLQFGTPAPPSG